MCLDGQSILARHYDSVEKIERAAEEIPDHLKSVVKEVLALEHCKNKESFRQQGYEVQKAVNNAAEEPMVSRGKLEAIACAFGTGIGTAAIIGAILWSNNYITINWK